MNVAIREGMIPGESLEDRLTWLESVGIEGVELHRGSLDHTAAELQAIFGQSAVRVCAIEGTTTLLHADSDTREAGKTEIRRRLALAGELGAVGVLVVPQFGRTPALPDLSPWKSGADLEHALLVEQLRELAPAAHAAGVKLFLEPLNRYEAYIVNLVGQGAEIAREAGPDVATMADFFHMNIEERDIPESIRSNAEHLVYVHVADSNRQQPGFGHLDFRPGFRTLKEIGYDGWLTIECSSIRGSYDDAIRETVTHLRTLWDAA